LLHLPGCIPNPDFSFLFHHPVEVLLRAALGKHLRNTGLIWVLPGGKFIDGRTCLQVNDDKLRPAIVVNFHPGQPLVRVNPPLTAFWLKLKWHNDLNTRLTGPVVMEVKTKTALPILLLELLTGCSSTGKDGTKHYYVLGFGIVSVNNTNPVSASVYRTHVLGVGLSDMPGFRVSAGYADSTTILIPPTNNVLIELTWLQSQND
jgi:hypothetical protein